MTNKEKERIEEYKNRNLKEQLKQKVRDEHNEKLKAEAISKSKLKEQEINKRISLFSQITDSVNKQINTANNIAEVGINNAKQKLEKAKEDFRVNKLFIDSAIAAAQLYSLYGGARMLTGKAAPYMGNVGTRLRGTNFANVSDAALLRYNTVGAITNGYQSITDNNTDWGGMKRPWDIAQTAGNVIGIVGGKNWLRPLGKFGTYLDNTADAIGMGSTITDAAEVGQYIRNLYHNLTDDNATIKRNK